MTTFPSSWVQAPEWMMYVFDYALYIKRYSSPGGCFWGPFFDSSDAQYQYYYVRETKIGKRLRICYCDK